MLFYIFKILFCCIPCSVFCHFNEGGINFEVYSCQVKQWLWVTATDHNTITCAAVLWPSEGKGGLFLIVVHIQTFKLL